MTMIKTIKNVIVVAMFSCIAMQAYAEDAPVYDVDSYPPQFDGSNSNAPARPAAPPTTTETPIAREQQPTALPDAPNPVADNSNIPPPPTANMSMDQRVARLEQQMTNAMHTDLSSKVADQQSEIQTLRGQVEDLTHQLQMAQNMPKSTTTTPDNTDSASNTTNDDGGDGVDAPKPKKSKTKVAAADTTDPEKTADDKGMPASTAAAGATDPATTASNDQPNVAEEQQIYQTAYTLIKAKKYNDAAQTLQKMLQKYPSGQFAGNAHYWLGELYGLMGKNDQSISEFTSVVKNYPDSPKIADAQLKLGLIYAAQLKWSDAKGAFKKVINHYPGTSSAHLASEQLKQIKQSGH
jgi:tol-pal system protein YbgF